MNVTHLYFVSFSFPVTPSSPRKIFAARATDPVHWEMFYHKGINQSHELNFPVARGKGRTGGGDSVWQNRRNPYDLPPRLAAPQRP